MLKLDRSESNCDDQVDFIKKHKWLFIGALAASLTLAAVFAFANNNQGDINFSTSDDIEMGVTPDAEPATFDH